MAGSLADISKRVLDVFSSPKIYILPISLRT